MRILNLAASLFDLLVDELEVDREAVDDLFGNGQLKKLITGPENIPKLNDALSRGNWLPEIYLVVSTFSRLFALFHRYRSGFDDLDNLGELFTAAYDAELATAKAHIVPHNENLRSAVFSKSTLLFNIMLHLVGACDIPVKTVTMNATNALSIKIGRVFTLTDDLADLTQDKSTGAANTILLELEESAGHFEEWRSQRYRTLTRRSIDELCHQLAWICNQLEGAARVESALRDFRARLLFYVRSWFEL
jgi:hypothetical protein